MAASASTNPAVTAASVLLLLLALVVVAAGAREAPPPEDDGDRVSAADGPSATLWSASAPVVLEEEAAKDGGPAAGPVTFDMTIRRDTRKCDSDARWNDQLCRTVCGMFKFHGYQFSAAPADDVAPGQAVAPRCCCCPAGANCVRL